MKPEELLDLYQNDPRLDLLINRLETLSGERIIMRGLTGSGPALITASVFNISKGFHLAILPEKESAAYFYNDLENLFREKGVNFHKKKILFYPTSYKRPYDIEHVDNTNVLSRVEALKRLTSNRDTIIVTYPEALCERVVTRELFDKSSVRLKKGEQISPDFITDLLMEYQFHQADFVVEPGQFSIRGGIVDVFSFTNDLPYRIEFYGEQVESIRSFDPVSQLSADTLDHITIVPDVQNRELDERRVSFLEYIPGNTDIWAYSLELTSTQINNEYDKACEAFANLEDSEGKMKPEQLFSTGQNFDKNIRQFNVVQFGNLSANGNEEVLNFDFSPQPSFNKNFDLLISDLDKNHQQGVKNIILSDNPKQIERLYAIFDDLSPKNLKSRQVEFDTMSIALHEGFIDSFNKIACYTDHQIFQRYHRFYLKEGYAKKEALTIKEFYDLKPGDFVTHIDHGIGRFDGLEKIDINGKEQEAIRLIYANEDLLYVSIHSLHRIAKYVGKEGTAPSLNKLGSNAWNKLKQRTKKKVKDIAKDLIRLYAKRRATEGIQYSPDSYLQHELEASFIYEDTPDQVKATVDAKADMEKQYPMDRLICGDVGFGKTEIAVRAAFKAVSESKQVAVLVPTTILALQHYKTFGDRLTNFPCTIDYINRFKSHSQQKETIKKLTEGKIDILIGTHRLISKDIQFKDLGLLIIDEEQKFGVAAKEKLRQLRVNVDTLTLTATPIPRTLQFSLMGARDLSIINTPPPNRFPIQTEIRSFGEDIIRDAINYEVSRGGQAFFVHNRVQNINDVADMVARFCPKVSIAVAHGQMKGPQLEKIMLDFIEGDYDVLISTTIIESGLDIPNVNTIIINDAQNYGLSDLHQLRGRVGRTNKKAFCYLLAPPLSVLTNEARKRLKALEEFSDLGSGFSIAMRDLDIRGAGNLLGAEQSGFISDIGYEMYQKILDEAMQELREGEFRELYQDEPEKKFVKECQIETDMAILIPSDYVTNITERMSLYKELDEVDREENLQKFREKLTDRFGPLPPQTEELMHTIHLRWKARETGFEKIVLKNSRFIGYLVSDQESPFYSSPQFTSILQYIKDHPRECRIRENKNKLSVTFVNVNSVEKAIRVAERIGL